MSALLFSLPMSHPGHAARLMLEHKGIEHRVINVPAGLQPLAVRAVGFSRNTVPALRIDGRRVQGSLNISRALDRIQPEPPLFPSEPSARAVVEEAERWAEAELQSVPRRIMRWEATNSKEARRWLAEKSGVPAPGLSAALSGTTARVFARAVGADDDRVRRDIAELPSVLDRVDRLLADGVIGGDQPNAADFQIATSVRVLLDFPELRPRIEDRPAAAHALRIQPESLGQIPPGLPPDWL